MRTAERKGSTPNRDDCFESCLMWGGVSCKAITRWDRECGRWKQQMYPVPLKTKNPTLTRNCVSSTKWTGQASEPEAVQNLSWSPQTTITWKANHHLVHHAPVLHAPVLWDCFCTSSDEVQKQSQSARRKPSYKRAADEWNERQYSEEDFTLLQRKWATSPQCSAIHAHSAQGPEQHREVFPVAPPLAFTSLIRSCCKSGTVSNIVDGVFQEPRWNCQAPLLFLLLGVINVINAMYYL